MFGRRTRGMADFHVAESKKWCSGSRRPCLFFILISATVLFLYNANIKDVATDFSTEVWKPFKSRVHNATCANTSDGSTEPGTAGSNVSSSSFLQATSITSTEEADTRVSGPPTPVPYTSPGPFLVEYPYEYHFIINEPHTCERLKPFVVLIVPVAPGNKVHRDIIRNTWGSETRVLGKVVKLFFLVGHHTGERADTVEEQLLQESREHHDVIQSDFLDCYKNLTIKTMVMLEWLDSYCSTASYAMKVDSDTFLNVRSLVHMLLSAPKHNYMTGHVARQAAVMRSPTSKWRVPVELYPHSQYPNYALGMGYILSLDLPEKLVEASRHVKALYIEDVYLGLCMEYLGIPPTNPPNLACFRVFPVTYNRCAYSKLIITTTQQSTDRVWIWKDFHRSRRPC